MITYLNVEEEKLKADYEKRNKDTYTYKKLKKINRKQRELMNKFKKIFKDDIKSEEYDITEKISDISSVDELSDN